MATRYDDDTKAEVMAALLQGQSVSAVAREYNLPKGTVSDWRRVATTKVQAGDTANTGTAPTLDELLLAYVAENLATLREQSKTFRDPTWLKKQPASALAVLHGVVADKTLRLLEAFGGGGDE